MSRAIRPMPNRHTAYAQTLQAGGSLPKNRLANGEHRHCDLFGSGLTEKLRQISGANLISVQSRILALFSIGFPQEKRTSPQAFTTVYIASRARTALDNQNQAFASGVVS
jgi:hypothetical protein